MSWALEVALAWQGTKGQSEERPRESGECRLIEEGELVRSLGGGGPGVLIREQVQLGSPEPQEGRQPGDRGGSPGMGRRQPEAGPEAEEPDWRPPGEELGGVCTEQTSPSPPQLPPTQSSQWARPQAKYLSRHPYNMEVGSVISQLPK